MLAGGCGRELATWIVEGRPTLDMYGYDIGRFWRCVCVCVRVCVCTPVVGMWAINADIPACVDAQ